METNPHIAVASVKETTPPTSDSTHATPSDGGVSSCSRTSSVGGELLECFESLELRDDVTALRNRLELALTELRESRSEADQAHARARFNEQRAEHAERDRKDTVHTALHWAEEHELVDRERERLEAHVESLRLRNEVQTSLITALHDRTNSLKRQNAAQAEIITSIRANIL
jgi:chromosome segregation ATPase